MAVVYAIPADEKRSDPAEWSIARDLGIDQRFAELAQKELGLGKKAFAKLSKDAETILVKTDHAHQP